MKNTNYRGRKGFWAGISPWFIIGAAVILVPIFIMMTMQNINKQKEYTTQLLVEKAEALIRSFEAGARTGMGMRWSSFQLQKLLIETAEQPGVDYIILTDTKGTIVADSDPSLIGEAYGTELDLPRIFVSKNLEWRQVPHTTGADTFEVYRRFAPTDTFAQEFFHRSGPDKRTPESGYKGADAQSPGLVIFVGMDMGPIDALRKQDREHAIWMSVIFVLIGVSGIISLILAQSYRSATISLARIKAFSDSLVENMPIGLVAINARGEIISFNQTAESVLGYAYQDVLGKRADEILPRPCKEILGSLRDEKKIIEREIDCPVHSGEIVPLEVIAATLEEENGDFMGFVILFRDITEVQLLKKEMERSRRLASLGGLAAGIAHEIRNPLSSIKGFATFFKERYRDNPEDQKTAEIMVQEVDRLNRVIGQLLEFARPMEMNRQWTSVNDVISHTLKMIEGEAREKKINIRTDFSPEVRDVLIDADKIKQVLLNLYLNSIGAMESGGTLSVALVPLWRGRGGGSSRGDRMIRIDVSDTGRGIDKKDLARIFDPYFTTKPSGTGLGLAIVYKIIEAHGGEIRVKSEPGKGTAVSVFLPVGQSSFTS
ncbi:MAG TPA: ATP-binding protein [Syntrophales bacterium]|nr:ATP-binding protein [Syntrophales bacterium]